VSEPSKLFLTNEAAENLRVTVATLKLWRTLNKGPRWVKLGTRVCYRLSDLEAFISAGERC
jgi:hypothetical protein